MTEGARDAGGWVNADDAERAAEAVLEVGVHGYFAGGAGEELTLAENRAAWRRFRLLPRVLTGVDEVSTAVELLGGPVSAPILLAPVAFQRLLDADGEEASARAAAAAGTVFCLSTLATAAAPEVSAAAPEGRRWFQLYRFRDGGVTTALWESALASGFEALVVTVDAPPAGNRERDLRTGFEIPAAVEVPGLEAALGSSRSVTVAEAFGLMRRGLGWADLGELVAAAGVPVLVKGVLAAADAQLAVEHGAAGVVVSNQGGRQLDRSPATAEVLAGVAEAVGGRAAVLVDGGIRRGVDVAVALAAGADAVLIGRPAIWGLAAAGETGVGRVLEMLREELELTLALCGCASPAGLSLDHLLAPPATGVYSRP